MSSRKMIRPMSERELEIENLKNQLSTLERPPDMNKGAFLIKLKEYNHSLIDEEYSKNTIKVYMRYATWFVDNYTDYNNPLRKEDVLLFKEELLENYESVQTINTQITSVGKFLHFCEQGAYNVKKVKGHTSNVLERRIYDYEYKRMVNRAKSIKDLQLHYTLKVMGQTGVRVNELKSFTTESILQDHVKVNNKGRIRLVPIPGKLVRELRKYVALENIKGQIFTYTYDELYERLKNLASMCKVDKKKVYPHAFRHYFGFHFISANSNNKIAELADILGHTSIETTRIYTRGTLADVKKSMEEM